MENFNIFEMLYETYKIKNDNPLRVIEFFGGYGSQTLALKYLGVKYEHWKLCEWAIPSIIAYASVHRNELKWYGENFCGDLTKEQIANQLFQYGVSADYNKPANLDQLKRMPEDKLRLCFNSIQWANNLVDISRVKGNELNIVDTDKFTYLLTYSFPCQDLSLAGKGAGMEKGSGTRSGLLWEVERILSECEHKPQILVMENVTQVHGAGNEKHFKQWQLRLEEMGYQSYWQDLSATEFKIPQTRNRTFMVSILGNYNYTFPKKTKLELRLKDLLEPEGTVDEKFYISDKMINYISKTGANGFNNKDAKINLDIARPLTTDPNKRAGTTNYLSSDFPDNFDLNELNKPSFEEVYEKIKNGKFQQQKERIQEKEVCDTLLARDYKDPKLVIESLKIKNATKKGYLEAHEGDGIYISSRMDSHRGTVQKGMAQTITTMGGENVGVAISVTASFNPNHKTRLRIRKLTPKECFRLQGVKDEDIDLIMQNQSNSLGYHLAGDSICITVLIGIFSKLFDIDWIEHFKPEEWWKN